MSMTDQRGDLRDRPAGGQPLPPGAPPPSVAKSLSLSETAMKPRAGERTRRQAAKGDVVAATLLYTVRALMVAATICVLVGGIGHIWGEAFAAPVFFTGLYLAVVGFLLREIENTVLE